MGKYKPWIEDNPLVYFEFMEEHPQARFIIDTLTNASK